MIRIGSIPGPANTVDKKQLMVLRRQRSDSRDDPLPVDDAGLDDLVELEEDEAVVEVGVQVVDVRLHAQRVHPVSVHCEKNKAATSASILF